MTLPQRRPPPLLSQVRDRRQEPRRLVLLAARTPPRGRVVALAALLGVLLAGCGSEHSVAVKVGSPATPPLASNGSTAAPVAPSSPEPNSQGPTVGPTAGRALTTSSVSTPVPTGPVATPIRSASACEVMARDVFVQAQSVDSPGGHLELTALPATLVCGGPDDSHFDIGRARRTLRLDPSCMVTILTTDDSGITTHQVQVGVLRTQLATGQPHSRIFQVTSDDKSVTQLVEEYRP